MAGIDKNELYRMKKEVEEYDTQKYNKASSLLERIDQMNNKLTNKFDGELTEKLKLEIISLLHESRQFVCDSHFELGVKLGKF